MKSEIQIAFNLFGCFNTFVLFAILCFRRNNSTPNYALAFLMVVPAAYFFNSLLMLKGLFIKELFFSLQFIAIGFLPSVYIYVYSLLGISLKKLVPLFLLSGIMGLIPTYLFYEFTTLSEIVQHTFSEQLVNGPYPGSITFYSEVFYGTQQVFFIVLLRKITKIKKVYKEVISSLSFTRIIYLQKFVALIVFLNFMIILLYLTFDILFVEYVLLPFLLSLVYVFIAKQAFENNTVFNVVEYKDHLENIVIKPISKSEEGLPSPELVKNIHLFLDSKEAIQNPNLTIHQLAHMLNTTSEVLSHVINEYFQLSFYDLINKKRVELSKELLLKMNHLTIEGIAYESGFKSRATFYRAFKKHEKITPTEYKKSFETH